MSQEHNGRMHGPLWKFMDWLVPPSLMLVGWLVIQVIEMRSNRFTDEDGRQVREAIHANALLTQRLQAYIEALQTNNERWLEHHEENLNELERALERHLERTNGVHK